MADFDMEQMRIIFQNLADKLANTKGDEATVDQLKSVEKAIAKLDKRISDNEKKTKAEQKKDNKEFLKEFAESFDEATAKSSKRIEDAIRESGVGGAGPGQGMLDKTVQDFRGGSSKVLGSLLKFGKFAGGFADGTAKMLDNVGHLDGSFKGLANAAGITSGAAFIMAKTMDENVDAYRSIISSAEGTIGSIQQLRDAASKSALGVEEFSAAIAKGTEGTRLLGAQPWAELYSSIKTQTKTMGYYGYSTQGLITAQNDYLDILANRGDIFDTGEAELVSGLDALLKVNNKTASILGITREEALKAQAAQSRDADTQTYLMGLGLKGDQKTAVENALATAEKIAPELKAILSDQFRLNGGMNTDTAQVAALLPPEVLAQVTNLSEQLRNGTISSDKIPGAFQQLSATFKETVDQQTQANSGTISAIQGVGEQFKGFNKINMGLQNIKPEDLITAQGTNQTDAGSTAVLQVEQSLKNVAAAAQDTISAVLNPLLTEYGPELKSLVGQTDALVDGFRKTIQTLQSFDSAMLAVGALFASGSIISAASGVVSGIVAARFAPLLGSVISTIASPLKLLGSGMSVLGKSLSGSALAKTISSSVAGAVSKLPGLGAAAGAAARVAAPVAVGLAAGEVAKLADDTISDYLYNNTSKESKDSWYAFRKEGEGFFDFMAQGINGVIQSGPNAGKNYWTGEQEYKQDEKGEWVEMSEEERAAAKVQSEPRTKDDDSRLDRKLETYDSNVTDDAVLKTLSALTPTVTTPIDPAISRVDPEALDVQGLAASTANTPVDTTLATLNASLERIYAILRQNLDFDKENALGIRDRLSEMNKLQEDAIRINRRG